MERFSNNVQTTLSAGITAGDASLTVASAAGFPSEGNFRIIVGSELMIVTAVSGTTFTVTRGAEGTTATSHSSGAAVTHIVTAGALGAIRSLEQVAPPVVLDAPAASITFSNIPQVYDTLELEVLARGDVNVVNTSLAARYNGDAGTNYSHEYMQGGGSTGGAGVAAAGSVSQTNASFGLVAGATAPANIYAHTHLLLPGYRRGVVKESRGLWSIRRGTTATDQYVAVQASWWSSTAAITSILLFPGSGNFVAGTRAVLYGRF